jgi:hypothetical protein
MRDAFPQLGTEGPIGVETGAAVAGTEERTALGEMSSMCRPAPNFAALAAVAVFLAGCGKNSKPADLNFFAKLDATARAHTIIDLYRRGELGTRPHLERRTGRRFRSSTTVGGSSHTRG